MVNKNFISCLIALFVFPLSNVYASDTGAIEADSNWIKAVKAGDVDAVVHCYDSNAILWVSGAKTAEGSNQIRAVYKNYLAKYLIKDAALTPMGSETIGNKSVAWGTYNFTLVPKHGGSVIVSTGRYTDVAIRSGDTWVLLVDHASDDPSALSTK